MFGDLRGDRKDFGGEFFLNAVNVVAIFNGYKIDGKTEVSKTTGTTDAMEIGFGVFGEIEIDNNVDGGDIDTTSKEIRRDEISASTLAKVMEDTITMHLRHFSVDIEARIVHLGNFFSKKLDASSGVAEDDGLVDAKFRKESVETAKLLFFFDISVVLGDTAKGEFFHKIDLIGLEEIAVSKVFDGEGESSGETEDLAIRR